MHFGSSQILINLDFQNELFGRYATTYRVGCIQKYWKRSVSYAIFKFNRLGYATVIFNSKTFYQYFVPMGQEPSYPNITN
jgi:hypothetical protein